VRFTSPDGTLIVEAGATFIGGVYGDGCALVMGSGAGTLGGFSVDPDGFGTLGGEPATG
jgi:hypothetical protein